VLCAVIAYSANRTQLEILSAGVVGFFMAQLIPASVLSRRARLRQKRIRKSLADALDLMVVCVEAGVGLDAAILRVATELHITHPEIAYEFRVVNQRVNAGLPRVDAMREMVSRTGVADLRSVITTLIQSERLGVSIGRVLRVASDGLRTRRRQAAEQTARKAPIKMLVPLVLFVLPALILVIIGPAAIHLLRVLRTTAP
jgi:tight adherence protein C